MNENLDLDFYFKNGFNYFILSKYFETTVINISSHISKIKKEYPRETDWIFYNNKGRYGRQRVINEECFLYFKNVVFNKDTTLENAKIDFFKSRISFYEGILNISTKDFDYSSMTKKEMISYFSRNKRSIDTAILKSVEVLGNDIRSIDDKGRVIINSEGIRYIEQHFFKRQKYIERLEKRLYELKVRLEVIK